VIVRLFVTILCCWLANMCRKSSQQISTREKFVIFFSGALQGR
jgi:hypothetical protein